MKNIQRIIIFILFLSIPSLSQSIKVKKWDLTDFPKIRVNISIENQWGAPIPVDTKKFILYEVAKGIEKKIENFTLRPLDVVKVPIYTVVIIDKSGSMKGDSIKEARLGSVEFIKMMKTEDRAGLIEFDTNVNILSEFTLDKNSLIERIKSIKVGTDTALIDAINSGVNMFDSAPDKIVKIILVLTDGRENKSKSKIEDVIKKAKEKEISIYTIGLGKTIDKTMLNKLSSETEGNSYYTLNPSELTEIYKKISLLLHSQLILEFKTPFPMDRKWHSLKFQISYMGKIIKGEKSYLSAKESRISTELLRQIQKSDEERSRKQQEERKKIEAELNRLKKQKEKTLIIILSGAIGVFLIVLILIIILKRRRS